MQKYFKPKQDYGKIARNPWLLLQDLVGDSRVWPVVLRKMFWEADLNYSIRLKLVTFCFQNGSPLEVFVAALRHTNKTLTPQREKEIRLLWKYIVDNPRIWGHYFAYDVIKGRVVKLNGDKNSLSPGR